MKRIGQELLWAGKIILGSALFALGFDLFLVSNNLNSGGISGLAMVLVKLTGFGSVGTVTMLLNLPLFVLGGVKIGKRFFVGSVIGMVTSSVLIDVFALLPKISVEPLLAIIYGGVICGLGLGMVFAANASTGGSDILIRLFKRRWQHVPLGTISIIFDWFVAILTGIVFQDLTRALYTGVVVFVIGQLIDVVLYRFDYSKVAVVISPHYEEIARAIDGQLQRGVTYLYGQGFFSGKDTKVILTAVKKQQLADLKRMVVEIDPQAFIIVQEAHQVLGDGFSRYSNDGI